MTKKIGSDELQNRITFSNVIGVLLEKLSFYDNAGFDDILNNIQDDLIPNLINVSVTREQLLELVTDSIDVIGAEKADEFARITNDAELITALIRYAILNDHDSRHTLLSQVLSDTLLGNRLPSLNRCFIGRKEEIKEIGKALQDSNLVFLTGTAGIVLEQYEALVLEHLSDTSLDYGICKLSRGIIDMMEGKPEPAEINLLAAERIIGNAMGTDNDYVKTTYKYLNNLYAKWNNPEKAIEYRDKYFSNRITTSQIRYKED